MNYYIHIPFCRQKCPYCKFALAPIFDEVKKRRYISYLKCEIRDFLSGQDFSAATIVSTRNDRDSHTVYFGGGTPSVLSLEEVKSILDCFPFLQGSNTPTFQPSRNEVSFECNPEDIQDGYIQDLLSLGINRISLGVQSLNNSTLTAIHRSDKESIIRALDRIEDEIYNHARTISVNIDFILGLPYTKGGETLKNIQELHKKYSFITHTSVYMLEDGLYPKEWKSQSISDEDMRDEYQEICTYFDSQHWNHYEISNWAKSGYECTHNQGYWTHSDYRGFGLSAVSYVSGKRWENSASFSGYYRGECSYTEVLTLSQIRTEEMIHSLRTFRLDSTIFSPSTLEKLSQRGLIKIQEQKIVLTPSGIFQENTILSELINEIDSEKDSPP